MTLPFAVTPFRQFNLADLEHWTATVRPTQIEMSDQQYSWYANLCRKNSRDFRGIPIVFTEGANIV